MQLSTSTSSSALLTKPSRWYLAAKGYLNMEPAVDNYFSKRQNAASTTVGKKLLGAGKYFGKLLTPYDFTKFIPSKVLRTRVSEPPLGALMLMMYLGLAGARAARGYQRGQSTKNGKKPDLREFKDAVRRDFWSITFYIFGFGWINKALVKRAQKKHGAYLQHPSGTIVTFSEHDANATIRNAKVLKAHITQGNKRALNAAANNNSYMGVPTFLRTKHPSLFNTVQGHVLKFRAALDTNQFENAMQHLNKLLKNHLILLLMPAMATKQLAKLQKKWPKYQDFLARHLQHKRIPLDISSFLMLFVLIGYGPVWFNRVWTEYQYNKKHGT